MSRKYVVWSRRSKLFLWEEQRVGSIIDRWTTMKGVAKTFDNKKEAEEAVDRLQDTSLCRSKEDCIIIPLLDDEDKNMIEFNAKIYHAKDFWREERISGTSEMDALNELFKEIMTKENPRAIESIELSRIKKASEQMPIARFERSM